MFIHVPSQTYPLSYDDIKKRHPQYSFPESINHQFLGELGYAAVITAPYPSNLRADEYAVLSDPAIVNGGWVRQYTIQQYSFSNSVDENGQPVSVQQAKANFAEGVKRQIRGKLADYRYKVETDGITLQDGTQIKTDRESQATVTGAYATSLLNPSVVIDWKGANGWVQINAAQIAAIATAVTSHVQSCFSKERQLSQKLDTLTPDEIFAFNIEAEWNAL